MYAPVDTTDPHAVAQEVQSTYLRLFPGGDPGFVSRVFRWTIEYFTGHYADFQAIDALYHDLEHTLQGALCMARLLDHRHAAGAAPALDQATFELGLLAILLHDTGYLKRREDTEGTGAKYTWIHVDRSTAFAQQFLIEKGFSPAAVQAVKNMIHCTGVNVNLKTIPFRCALEQAVGFALGTADLLGQMAADDYVEKLPELFLEFDESARNQPRKTGATNLFSSAEDLIRKTPAFWEKSVLPRLRQDYQGLYQFLNDPYPDGPNYYVDRIESNMARVRRQVAAIPNCS